MNGSTIRRRFHVARQQIGFVKFILEAYDNLATVSTVDARSAVIEVAIAPGCESVVDKIMDSLPVSPMPGRPGSDVTVDPGP
jgi:hypothetical protein